MTIDFEKTWNNSVEAAVSLSNTYPCLTWQSNRTEFDHLTLGPTIFSHGVDPNRPFFIGETKTEIPPSIGLLRTKFTSFKLAAAELGWMLNGGSNVNWLRDRGVTFWDEWADKKGDLGPVYGAQWRNFGGNGVDQLWEAFCRLRSAVQSGTSDRRIMVSAWNPDDVPDMALPPCHFTWQVSTLRDIDGKQCLSVNCFQRSGDLFLGIPYNMAFYSILRRMLIDLFDIPSNRGLTNLLVSDLHVYRNHIPACKEVQDVINDRRFNTTMSQNLTWAKETPSLWVREEDQQNFNKFKAELMRIIDSRDSDSFKSIDWFEDVIRMYVVRDYESLCRVSAQVAV